MRLKLGRPDLSQYSELFNVPRANDASRLTVTFLGVSTLLVRDGQQAFMTDGFFSRPGLVPVGIGFVFVLEVASAALQIASKKILKRKIFISAPIHHHFEAKGWPETKVTMRFWILGQVFAVIGLLFAVLGGFLSL